MPCHDFCKTNVHVYTHSRDEYFLLIIRCKLQNIYRFINVKAGWPILPGIGTNSLGSKFRAGINCLGNFGRPEHLVARPSSLIHRFPQDVIFSVKISDQLRTKWNHNCVYFYLFKCTKYLWNVLQMYVLSILLNNYKRNCAFCIYVINIPQ